MYTIRCSRCNEYDNISNICKKCIIIDGNTGVCYFFICGKCK